MLDLKLGDVCCWNFRMFLPQFSKSNSSRNRSLLRFASSCNNVNENIKRKTVFLSFKATSIQVLNAYSLFVESLLTVCGPPLSSTPDQLDQSDAFVRPSLYHVEFRLA